MSPFIMDVPRHCLSGALFTKDISLEFQFPLCNLFFIWLVMKESLQSFANVATAAQVQQKFAATAWLKFAEEHESKTLFSFRLDLWVKIPLVKWSPRLFQSASREIRYKASGMQAVAGCGTSNLVYSWIMSLRCDTAKNLGNGLTSVLFLSLLSVSMDVPLGCWDIAGDKALLPSKRSILNLSHKTVRSGRSRQKWSEFTQ